jgi:hypothetical protein
LIVAIAVRITKFDIKHKKYIILYILFGDKTNYMVKNNGGVLLRPDEYEKIYKCWNGK